MAWEPKHDIDRAYRKFELRVGERAARHEQMVLATIAVVLGLCVAVAVIWQVMGS